MVEDVTSVTNSKEDHLHLTVTENDSFMKENVIASIAIDKTKDESGQEKEKAEAVSKVFCSLEENDEEAPFKSSWRDESTDHYESDEEDSEYDWNDEDEAAAEEWHKRHELREKGLLSEAAFSLPPTIKVSIVPLSEEEKRRHQEKERAELGRLF